MNPLNQKTTLIQAKPGSLIVRIFLISMVLLMSQAVFASRNPNSAASEADLTAAVNALKSQISTLQNKVNGSVDYFSNPPDYETVVRYCPNTQTWQSTLCTYSIGHTGPAGGIVFYVTDNGMHGLEAAPSGWYNGGNDPSAEWGCDGTTTGATGTVVGTGAANTVDILQACSTTGIAAQLAHAYDLTTTG